jgi:hypothetical protein
MPVGMFGLHFFFLTAIFDVDTKAEAISTVHETTEDIYCIFIQRLSKKQSKIYVYCAGPELRIYL